MWLMNRGSFDLLCGNDVPRFIWGWLYLILLKDFAKMLAEGGASTDVGLVDQISSIEEEEEEEENEGLLSISFLQKYEVAILNYWLLLYIVPC